MKRRLIDAAAGAVVALALTAGIGAAQAGDGKSNGPVDVRCYQWTRNPNTTQCNLYFTEGKHMRTRFFYKGEWLMTDDMWPLNFERVQHVERGDQ